jgi:hypothetical protein
VPLSSGSSGSRIVGLVELLQIVGTIKGEVRVHAMKAYRGRCITAPLILNLRDRCRWSVNWMPSATYLRERNPVPKEQEPTFGFLRSHFLQ